MSLHNIACTKTDRQTDILIRSFFVPLQQRPFDTFTMGTLFPCFLEVFGYWDRMRSYAFPLEMTLEVKRKRNLISLNIAGVCCWS